MSDAPELDPAAYDVLNVVVLKKMATTEGIVGATGVEPATATETLDRLSGQSLVVVLEGSALPADAAEPALEAAAATRYAAVREDTAVQDLVERFDDLNTRFLAAMSSWQQVDVGGRKVTNDHGDSAYDDKVIDRVEKLVQRLEPLLAALAGHDPRFARYGERFGTAVGEIDAGKHEFVASPTVESVHNLWFEFHEDLLRTLGRKRVE